MSSSRRGYLTMSVDSHPYLRTALDMVLSLREHTDPPAALATDGQARLLDEVAELKPSDRLGRMARWLGFGS
jgi:hypothetical protein